MTPTLVKPTLTAWTSVCRVGDLRSVGVLAPILVRYIVASPNHWSRTPCAPAMAAPPATPEPARPNRASACCRASRLSPNLKPASIRPEKSQRSALPAKLDRQVGSRIFLADGVRLDLHRAPAVEGAHCGLAAAGFRDGVDQFGQRAERIDRVRLQRFRHRFALVVVRRHQLADDRLAVLVVDLGHAVDAAPDALADEPGRQRLLALPGAG